MILLKDNFFRVLYKYSLILKKVGKKDTNSIGRDNKITNLTKLVRSVRNDS